MATSMPQLFVHTSSHNLCYILMTTSWFCWLFKYTDDLWWIVILLILYFGGYQWLFFSFFGTPECLLGGTGKNWLVVLTIQNSICFQYLLVAACRYCRLIVAPWKYLTQMFWWHVLTFSWWLPALDTIQILLTLFWNNNSDNKSIVWMIAHCVNNLLSWLW